MKLSKQRLKYHIPQDLRLNSMMDQVKQEEIVIEESPILMLREDQAQIPNLEKNHQLMYHTLQDNLITMHLTHRCRTIDSNLEVTESHIMDQHQDFMVTRILTLQDLQSKLQEHTAQRTLEAQVTQVGPMELIRDTVQIL